MSKFILTPANARQLSALIAKYQNHMDRALIQRGAAIINKENVLDTAFTHYQNIYLILLKIDKKVRDIAGCVLEGPKLQSLISLAEKIEDPSLKEFIENAFTTAEPTPARPTSSSIPSLITSEEFNTLLILWKGHSYFSPYPKETIAELPVTQSRSAIGIKLG